MGTFKARAAMAAVVATAAFFMAAIAQGAPATEEQVGDVDSFGQNVRYLGMAQTSAVGLRADCTIAPADEHCIQLAAPPVNTDYEAAGLAHIDLPAAATHSLLCFALTPIVGFEFRNDTGGTVQGQFEINALVRLLSKTLVGDKLINPLTGLPFNGFIDLELTGYREARTVFAGEDAFKRFALSRECIGGLISRHTLMTTYGLTEAQSSELFAQPLSVLVGVRGRARMVSVASITYGIRLYGDGEQ